MSALLLALLACALAGIGGRDAGLVAGLALRGAPLAGLVVVAAISTVLTTALAAWAGGEAVALLVPDARTMLAGFALLIAGGEALLIGAPRVPAEPTHSLGALLIVLLAQQIADPVRLLVFAIALARHDAIGAGLGGIIGGGAALGLGIAVPQLGRWPRRAAGAVLLMVGAAVALTART